MSAKQHFELHFTPDSWVLYEELKGGYYRTQWKNLVKWGGGVKRLHYNTSKWKNYIIIDIDNENIYKYREQKLPEPNFILHNKDKAGGHLFYVLDKGIYQESNFYLEQWKQVHKNFTIVSGGDVKAKGYVGKYINSNHFKYEEIEPKPYSISYLYSFINNKVVNNQAYRREKQNRYIDTTKNNKKPYRANIGQKNLDLILIGERNDTLFNKARKYAYIQVLKLSKHNFERALKSYINNLNNELLAPQEQSEIDATAKSIIKYCLENKERIENYSRENAKDRGVMGLQEKEIELKEKQRLGAEYTAEQKQSKTIFKLKLSIIEMKARDLKINNTSLSKWSKISLATVKRYKEDLKF